MRRTLGPRWWTSRSGPVQCSVRRQPLAGRVELWLETATQSSARSLHSTPLGTGRSIRERARLLPRCRKTPQCPPPSPTSACPPPCAQRLAELGIAEPFPVQAATLPDALAGRDVCGKAPTGSGKTIAFGIPLVARVEQAAPTPPHGLVLVPTRELAAQVQDQLAPLAAGSSTAVARRLRRRRLRAPDARRCARGVDIVVACPGRLTTCSTAARCASTRSTSS